MMRIVAVMSCRNDAAFLPTCLHHLVTNDIEFALVDNDSTDESMDIAHSSDFRDYLIEVKKVAYHGALELKPLLQAKMALAESIPADWVLNIDTDEILHPNREGTTLYDEVGYFDRLGFNVVNFDEFVFLPIEQSWVEGFRGWPAIRHYYFFEPSRFRLMRLWKKGFGLANVRHGGHRLDGEKRFAPESLVLRHYMFRDQAHAFEKYTNRRFSKSELSLGWHRNRHGYHRDQFEFPALDKLEVLERPDSFGLNRSRPWKKHYWQCG